GPLLKKLIGCGSGRKGIKGVAHEKERGFPLSFFFEHDAMLEGCLDFLEGLEKAINILAVKHDRRALATSGKFRNFYKLPVGAFFQINEKSPLSPLNLLRNQFLTIPAIFGIERLRHDISRENVFRHTNK